MKSLVGIDITAHPERHSIVPEGIDLETVDLGVSEAADFAAGQGQSGALDELHSLLEQLPASRRGLPLVVERRALSPGEGHGHASSTPGPTGRMQKQANLLLIGGDLVSPSADEREQLDPHRRDRRTKVAPRYAV